MTVMLGIALALANLFIPKIRAIAEAGNSTRAIYAADSATEVCLYEARNNPPTPIPRLPPILTNGATFTIASLSASPVDVTNDCRPMGLRFRFRALGSFGGVSRALEIAQ